ncbi:M23 family metallopeptidase [Streptomyces thinghirensis]|nr:M23 family metallopeptidase [Streptomyces thinghirensis]
MTGSGGGLPLTAQMILAEDHDELMRGQRALSRADLAVNNAIGKSLRAEARLAADEAKAQAAWQALEERNAGLAELKKKIEGKLEAARSRLEGQADAPSRPVRVPARSASTSRAGAPAGPGWPPVETPSCRRPSAAVGAGGRPGTPARTSRLPVGTPVRSVGAGRVVKVSCGGAFGIQVVVQHAGGYYTQYAHLAAVAVDQGDRVRPGQWVGQSGSTGNSTGPHLHFRYGSPRRWARGWTRCRGCHNVVCRSDGAGR